MIVPYLCQISASVLGWFGEVQALDLPACSPEQPVSHTCRMLCQLPHSISLHLKQVVLISNLGKCVDLPQMYCDALSRYLNPGIAPLLNFLPAVVFRLVLNYIMSVECLFFDWFAGLAVMESLLEWHLANLFLANVGFDEMVQDYMLNHLFCSFESGCH